METGMAEWAVGSPRPMIAAPETVKHAERLHLPAQPCRLGRETMASQARLSRVGLRVTIRHQRMCRRARRSAQCTEELKPHTARPVSAAAVLS